MENKAKKQGEIETPQRRALAEANDDWSRANAAANRAIDAMAIIPQTEPLYKELEAELAIAKAERIEAGDRISALSLAVIAARRQVANTPSVQYQPGLDFSGSSVGLTTVEDER